MRCTAALSTHPTPTEASGEVIGRVLETLGVDADLACVFVTAPFAGALEDIAGAVREVLRPRTLLGTTAVSVVGGDQEIEDDAAITLWAASFDGAAPPPQAVRLEALPTAEGTLVAGMPDDVAPGSTLVVLADPFTTPIDAMLAHWHEARPELSVIGGLASAARGPGGNRLVLDGAAHTDGAVGALLPPGVAIATVVSQGCRPIGSPMIVTKAERNVIYELAGQPALTRLMAMVEDLDGDERALVQHGLHLGQVIDERKIEFSRGDFLVRNVLGADRDLGAIAVGDAVDVGSTVQFQVRDAASADEDLRSLLSGHHATGALVFTCNGRGSHLFGRPGHDAEVVSDHVEHDAVGGMFCAGEVGPIGGRSFLHGFTASVLLFEDAGVDVPAE